MSLAKVFDKLGEQIVPAIAAKVFPDLMYVMRDELTSDGAGGQINAGQDEVDNGDLIPCTYEPISGSKSIVGDKITSKMSYSVTFPTNQFGYLLEVTTNDRLKVIARGNQLDKIFKVSTIGNESGVVYEAICELES